MSLNIEWIDFTVILVYLLITVLLGLWLGRGEQSTRGYFLGNKQLPGWALLISIVASETSTVTFLSIPGQSFGENGNFRFLQLALGFVVGRIAVAWLILPRYFRGELLTSYELLDQQMGQGTRQLSSGLFLLTRTVGDALRLFLTALVLFKVTQLNIPLCILIVGVATIAYTFFGGLKAVVWNDCIQFAVYIGGAAWALYVLVHSVGGWSTVWEFGQRTDRLDLIDWNIQSTGLNFWVGLIGGGFLSFATHGTDHMVVQRLLGSRSERDARTALILSGVVVFLQFTFFLIIGLALACFYDRHPPSVAFGSSDEVFATFIVNELPVGLVGVILAAVFAAAMSTQSSSLNSLAAAFVNDFYLCLRPDADNRRLLWIGRFATAIFGWLQIGVAILAFLFLMENRSTIDVVFEVAAFAYGPVLGLFFLALWFPEKVDNRIGLISFAFGLATILTLKILSMEAIGVLKIPGLWFTAIGSIATLSAGWFTARRFR